MCENRSVVFAASQMSKPRSHPAIAGGKLAVADLSEQTDLSDAVAGEPTLHCRSDAPQQRDRFAGEECRGLAVAENREAARLVEVGAIFARNLLSLNPIDTVMPCTVSIRLASLASSWAGQASCRASVPARRATGGARLASVRRVFRVRRSQDTTCSRRVARRPQPCRAAHPAGRTVGRRE
jgi:hypothetical protein